MGAWAKPVMCLSNSTELRNVTFLCVQFVSVKKKFFFVRFFFSGCSYSGADNTLCKILLVFCVSVFRECA
jgi:hypothetical protein